MKSNKNKYTNLNSNLIGYTRIYAQNNCKFEVLIQLLHLKKQYHSGHLIRVLKLPTLFLGFNNRENSARTGNQKAESRITVVAIQAVLRFCCLLHCDPVPNFAPHKNNSKSHGPSPLKLRTLTRTIVVQSL